MSNITIFALVNLQRRIKARSIVLKKSYLRQWYSNSLILGLPATIDVLDMIEYNRERNWF